MRTRGKIRLAREIIPEPPTNTDSSVFIRILKDEKLKNTDDGRAEYVIVNIKEMGRGPIILRK